MGFFSILFSKKIDVVSSAEAHTRIGMGYRVANVRGRTIAWNRS